MKRALAGVLALLLVLAPVAPVVVVAPASAAPAGMATIPDSGVSEDVPAGESIPLSASALEGDVLAGDHADSLEVVLTTADHAPTVMDSDSAVIDGDGMAVVLRDDQNSAGREIAINAGTLQDALGYRPQAIHGTHEDGSEWTASAEYVDGYLVFDVPHFSSNTVTFSGSVEISMTSASDSTTAEWSVSDYDAVSNISVNATGVENTEQESVSVSDGSSIDVGGNVQPTNAEVTLTGSISETSETVTGSGSGSTSESLNIGSLEPRGPDGTGDPELSVTATSGAGSYNPVQTQGDGVTDATDIRIAGDSFDDEKQRAEVKITPDFTGEISSLTVDIGKAQQYDSYDPSIDVYLVQEGTDFGYGEGTKIASGWNPSFSTGEKTIPLDTTLSVSSGTTYTLEFVTTNSNNNGSQEFIALNQDNSAGSTWATTRLGIDTASEQSYNAYPAVTLSYDNSVDGLDATTSNGNSATFGDFSNGETKTKTIDIKSDGSSISFGETNGGSYDYTLDYTDRDGVIDPSVSVDGSTVSYSGVLDGSHTESITLTTGSKSVSETYTGDGAQLDSTVTWTEGTETVDPTVEINGNTTTVHSGTLAAGSTASTTILKSELQQGSNQLNVSLNDGSLPAGSPAMQTDLEVSHDASDKVSVGYTATVFEESYNISRTYADETTDAQATIPFESSRVIGVKNVEYQVDDDGWQSVDAKNYRFEDTTLDVYVSDAYGSDLPSGSTVDVRATGRKVSVENGAVTVTDPTAPGEELDTQLQIDDRQPDFRVNVGPTDDGDRVHYAYSDSFPTEDYVVIQADGDQQLYLPNSKTGDTFRVKHLDTRVVADRGDVRIDVVKAGENPELDVSPGPGGEGDPVTIEYYNTQSGTTYLLESLTRSIIVDSDVAQSPAIFEDDDSDETWTIFADTGGGGSDGGGGGAVGQFEEKASGFLDGLGIGFGQFALLGVFGLGGVIVLRRFWWPFGEESDDLETAASTTTSSIGDRMLSGLERGLGALGDLLGVLLSNRRASIAAGILAVIVAARVGVFSLPSGTGILIVVSGVPVATYLVLRRTNAVSQRVWIASTLVAVVLGLEFVAPGTVQTAIEQLTSENVAPLLILVAAGGLYAWYRLRQSDRPQIIFRGGE